MSNLNGGLDVINIVSDPTAKTEKEKVADLLDSFLHLYGVNNESFTLKPEILVGIINRLRRARKEFDSTRFFVLIVGPLKSGKSTFVNILSRKKVSPTDVLECTAVPTIIGKADGDHLNKIVQYFPKNSSHSTDEMKADIFDKIIDTLRGIEDKDLLNNLVKTKVDEASDPNIEQIVMFNDKDLEKRPMIATIGVNGGPFVDNGIMIIDMPGLDGKGANDKDPLYQKMVERADFIFFVQSSTAALNEATSEFLDWLLAGKLTEVPLRFVHNIHESLYYIDDKITTGMIKRQINAGKKYIVDRFNVDGNFENFAINFAKISYGLMNGDVVKVNFKDDISNAVREYETLEHQIVDSLKKDRQAIKDKNSISKAIGNIEISISELKSLSDLIDEMILKAQETITIAENLPSKFSQYTISFAELKEKIDDFLKNQQLNENIINVINEESRHSLRNIARITGADLIRQIDNLTNEYNSNVIVGNNSTIRNGLITLIEKFLVEKYKDLIDEVNAFLTSRKANTLDTAHQIDKTLFPDSMPLFSSFHYDIETRWLFIFPRRYNATEHKEYLERFIEYSKSQVSDIITEYQTSINISLITIKEDFIKRINDSLVYSISQMKKSLEGEIASLCDQKTLIAQMIEKLKYDEN